MIPKIIHCVWFGKGEMNDRAKHCIETWKKVLPDYKIMKWTEDNFDINYNDFTKHSYENKKYAFTSDVARLWALDKYGGIYMDTDVEVYKPLDEFLNNEGFIGFEDTNYLSTAVIGAEEFNPVIEYLLDFYDCIDFKEYPVWTDYIKYQETSPCIVSNLMELLGLNRNNTEQEIKHFKIYPNNYFHTKDEGYTYHSYNGSW